MAHSEKEKGEKFKWTWREAFLHDYLSAISSSLAAEANDEGNFSEVLKAELLNNANLRVKIKKQPKIALKTIGSLSCGHRIIREVIQEVLTSK